MAHFVPNRCHTPSSAPGGRFSEGRPEARTLIDGVDITSPPGLRDRALIGLMVYTFARVVAAVAMKVEDYYVQGRRGWVRLHDKGGKDHEMPAHHNLDRYLEEYIAAAGIAQDRKAPLFVRPRAGPES